MSNPISVQLTNVQELINEGKFEDALQRINDLDLEGVK